MSNEFMDTNLDIDALVLEGLDVDPADRPKRVRRKVQKEEPVSKKKSKSDKKKIKVESEPDPRTIGRFIIPSTGLVPITENRIPSVSKMKNDLRRREVYRLRLKEQMTLAEIREQILANADDFLDRDGYSIAAVRSDLLYGMKLIATEIKVLHQQYVQLELDKLDDFDSRNMALLDGLEHKISYLMMQEEADSYLFDTMTKLITTYLSVQSTMQRASERRSKFLGLDAPTKTQTETVAMNISLDDFLRAKEQFTETHSNAIDGEVRYLDELGSEDYLERD